MNSSNVVVFGRYFVFRLSEDVTPSSWTREEIPQQTSFLERERKKELLCNLNVVIFFSQIVSILSQSRFVFFLFIYCVIDMNLL